MIEGFLRLVLSLMEPISLVWMGSAALGVCLWRRRQRRAAIAAGAMFILFTVVGGTGLSGWMLWRLERPWAGLKIADIPAADAVLVLGGGGEASPYEAGGVRLTKAGDRLTMALELMRLGKAPVLVVSGGVTSIDGDVKVEADVIKSWLDSWKSPALGEVVSLGAARVTRDEAVRFAAVAKQRGWRRVLLVTSASHMRRAIAVFRAVGVEAVPAPCNFVAKFGGPAANFPITVPALNGFEKFNIWFHETVGWAVYRSRGWVGPASGQ
jgi:uncharacterized SAM-binding protein YcdF (DUF218 family)